MKLRETTLEAASKKHDVPLEHARKFSTFLQMIDDAKEGKNDVAVVGCPHDLGDTYEELVTNLRLLRDVNLLLGVGDSTCPQCKAKSP